MRMKLGLIRKFAMALAMVVSAGNVFAADVAPLYFDGVAADDQQPYWEELMSFKMWGTEGISFGHATLTDLSGAVGTAHDLDLQIEKHTIGGPLYVGGNISGSNGGDTLLSGPVRVKGNFTAGQNGSRYNGLYCIEGSANNRLTEYAAGYGSVFQGSDAKTGECSYDNIKDVPTYLTIPKIPDHAYEPAISINGSYTIDVPPLSDGKMHDFYFEKISFNNSATLIIRMESAKSLARIFLRDNINVSSATNIKIVYVDKGATFVNGHWTNVTTETQVANADYAGNLMFYMKGDMTWPAMNKGMAEQGTFISQGTITVGPNLNLAGQFLATNVVVGHEFDGSGFRYVPFDPPILKLEPEVGQPLDFSENDTWTKVSIKLDVAPSTAVRFDYCFEFAPDWYFTTVDEDGVRLYDKAPAASLDDVTRNGVKPFPLCGESTAKVEFAAGSRIPKEDYSVWINAKIDNNVEPKESIRLQIHNLEGAVMPGGERDGEFEVFIIDGDSDPSSDDHAFTVAEDEAHVFVGGSSAKGTACAAGVDFCYHTNRDRDQAGVTIMTVPERGTLTYKGKPVVAGEDGEVGLFVPVEDLAAGKLTFRSNEHDYDVDGVYGSFEFTVTDVGDVDHGYPQAVSDRYTITIYVTPVNDYPTVVENQNMSVPENSPAGTTVGAFDATDVDGDKLKFEFDTEDENFETVSALFDINQENGLVTVKEGAVLDFESSATIFTITVKVTDDASTTGNVGALTSTGTLTINVTDVNEIQSVVIKDADDKVVQDSILRIDEGSKYPDVVGTVLGDDPDVNAVDETWNTFTYKIVENSDADKTNDVPFDLNEKTGLIKVDNIKDLKLDYETDSVFVFHVEVTDKAGEFTVIKEVTVKLNDINEAPEFGTVKDVYTVFENSEKGEVFAKIDLIDQDAGELKETKVSLADNNKVEDVVSAEDLFDVVVVQGKTEKDMQIAIFVKDDKLLDYESLYESHYDAESGKVVFDVTLTVVDKDGEEIKTTTKIEVLDSNEEPTTQNDTFEIAEYTENGAEGSSKEGDFVGQVVASDPDTKNPEFGTLYYSIVENTDEDKTNDVPFTVTEDGKILVGKDADRLNLEGDEASFVIHVAVTDGLIDEPKIAEITINLTNVNEPPSFADDGKDWNINEHVAKGTLVSGQNLIASDADAGDELTYSMTDASKIFTIDPSTGKVSVKDSVKLDYELYAKSEKEKVSFEVTIIATDKDGETASIKKTIVINDVNEDPSTKDDAFEVAEFTGIGEEGSAKEGDFVGQVTATDPDTKNADFGTLYYSIVENTDADKTNDVPFTITEDGKILVGKDVERLNLEGDDASFVIHVAVTDGLIDEPKIAEITITLTNVNENPVITDDGKDWNVNEHVAKGTVVSGQNLSASDPDADDVLTFSMTDASGIFTIDPSTGKVSVKDSVKLDYELYAKSEKEKVSFDVTIVVTDADGKTASKKKTIVINDVNEDPSTKDDSFEVAEFTGIGEEGSSKEGDFVGQVTATDPDTKNADFGTLYYSIVENTDADKTNDVPFTVTADGKILVGKDVERLNLEGDEASFVIHVAVTDGVVKEPKIAEITITLTNVNEPPTIADDGKDWNINEHVAKGSVVAGQNLTASDADAGDKLTFSMTDASGIFVIDPSTGKVSVKDSVKLDYELYAKSENEKVSFEVTVVVADVDGRTDAVKKTIVINDVNEAPKFEKPDVPDVGELRKNGDVVATVVANDPDTKNTEFRHLEYTIVTPDMPMAMDGNKVVVTDASKFDFETNPKFVFDVEVKNCLKNATTGKYTESCLADTVNVSLSLFDEDEKPEIIPTPDCDENDENCHKCDASIADCEHIDVPPPSDCVENCGYAVKDTIYINVKENSPAGSVILEYLVKDQDKDDVTKLIPTFVSTNKSGADSLFTISLEKKGDDYKIVLKVAEGADLDYEKVNDLHKLVIAVTDPSGLKDEIFRVINVVDVNEAPVIVKQNFNFDEHNTVGSKVGKIEWGDDLDSKNPSFRDNMVEPIGGDTAKFKVDVTGLITTKVPFNYETNDSSYSIIVKVKDKNDPTLFVVDTMTIKLNNVPETPHITSTEFDIPENPKNKEVIGKIVSEDLDDLNNKEKRVYTMIGTSDYVTVTEDGQILVKDSTKFDFEKVESFSIKVKVSDPQGDASDTTIVIKITDQNEAPTIGDQTIVVSEDVPPKTVIDTIKASDPDVKSKEFGELTYAIVDGDTAVFAVDSKTGEVILKDALDYEKKTEYKLVVEVFDGLTKDSATVTVKVGNVDEKSVVEITKVTDGDSSWVKPDSVFTNRPEVTICWNEGREVCEKAKCTVKSKEVCQDTTLTEGSHTIIKEFKDPTTDVPGRDTVVVFVSTSTPVVTVTANAGSQDAANIYTIEEALDEKDSSIYVNDSKNDILVTIKDPVTKKDSSFVVKLELDTLNVKEKDLESVAAVAEKSKLTLNQNPTSGVTRTPVNGNEIKMSYTEDVGGKKVTVSYVTDNDGEVLKTPVIDEKGEVDSIEVITVSYETTIGGKKVTVSYQADALTGQVLNVASDGTLTFDDKIVVAGTTIGKPASSSSGSKPSSSSSSGKPGSNSSDSKPGSSNSEGNGGSNASEETVLNVGSYKVTYDYVDERGNSVVVTYTIDEKGNIVKNGEGDIGYTVSYTYENKFGNSATQSVFIVLDQVGPKVEILFPTEMQKIYSNYINVTWAVNGVIQDTLTVQGLEKGFNKIVRFYRDKAGNVAYDSVIVIMKDGKDVDLAVEEPVVQLTQDKVDEYYAVNPPKEGEKVAISIRNPTTGREVETQIAGSFGTEDGSGDTPYPGVSGDGHLGPTVSMDIRLPVVNDVGGLATLDDLIGSDGLVSLDGVDAKDADKVSVDEYVETYCKTGFKYNGDLSRVNLYKTRMDVKIWIYTTLGNFVDYYSFRQDLNDPDYTNEAGLLQMYFEMKPDRDGEVRTADGHVLATGAYLYKVEAKVHAELQCTLPPVKDETADAKKKGDVIKKSDEMLKSFGYKRPEKK